MIDISFNMESDSNGRDPDMYSPNLRRYHKLLWSKPLPSGKHFELRDDKADYYLWHSSSLGTFSLGSDAITHSYKNQKRKKWLVSQIPEDVDELYAIGVTIGAYLIFPNKQVDRKNTINQARGRLHKIDDRFDLTLECIKRFYNDEWSPLKETFDRYRNFFDLFSDFNGYVEFFLLQDLVNDQGDVQFYLPFDDFKSAPEFRNVDDYLHYKDGVIKFVRSRNKRIEEYARTSLK